MVKKEIFTVKNWKNLSEKLLSVLLIQLTELQLIPQEAFRYESSCGIRKEIFESP